MVVQRMRKLLEAIRDEEDSLDHQLNADGQLVSQVEIGKGELQELGLGPTCEDYDIEDGIYHITRLIPYVEKYGVQGARDRMVDWIASEKGEKRTHPILVLLICLGAKK